MIGPVRLPAVPEHAGFRAVERQPPERPRSDAAPAATAVSQPLDRSPESVLALQRSAGNRATARALARWAAHPDKDKKGKFMTDGMAEEWSRFNPPLSK